MPITPEPYYSECKKQSEKQNTPLCPSDHCNDENIKNYTHAICSCTGDYAKFIYNGKCLFGPGSPIPVVGQNCNCCCSCFANGTPVAYADEEYKAIEDFKVGEFVYVADGADLKNWSQKEVKFSAGSGGPGSHNLMLMVVFENHDGEHDFLLCTRNQPFLMSDRRLKRANKLVPGVDQLLRQDNTSSTVVALQLGSFKNGLHHIATSMAPATSMAGHLLVAKGIVVADYALQIADITRIEGADAVMVDNHEALPVLGTDAYFEAYPHLSGDEHGVQLKSTNEAVNALVQSEGTKTLPYHEDFIPKGLVGPMIHPEGASHFVTPDQADDLAKAPHDPPGTALDYMMATYLFRVFKGFYPEVHFYIDPNNPSPNAHSYNHAGVPFVILNDGLLRMNAMKYELTIFVIAHELAHLYSDGPKDSKGYSCTGKADFAAIQAIIPTVWFGVYANPIIKAATKQVEFLFNKYISDENKKGKPNDRCIDISIACRIKSIKNAGTMGVLPYCAGGNPDAALEVVGAKVQDGKKNALVTVGFNLDLDEKTALSAGNYEFHPEAQVMDVTMDEDDPKKVVVHTKLEPGTAYTVYVYGVYSDKDQPLISDANKAEFVYGKIKSS